MLTSATPRHLLRQRVPKLQLARREYVVVVADRITSFPDKTLTTHFYRRAVWRARRLQREGYRVTLKPILCVTHSVSHPETQ